MADIHEYAGLFTITTGAPGAPTLRLMLIGADDNAEGIARLTQATNPPLNAPTALHGVVHALGLGKAEQIFALHGQAIPPRAGATYVPDLLITLDGIFASKGVATYTIFNDTPHMATIKNAPVKVEWFIK